MPERCITLRPAVADYAPPDALLVATDRARAVYAAAGYRPDGTVRESDSGGAPLRELRLVKPL